jgi:broad specificity phosphatase PhoE
MTSRVLLISHAATAATRHTAFPGDEPLATTAITADPLPRVHLALSGPEHRCRQTAELLDLRPDLEPRLRDCDYGRWRGRTLDELSAAEPEAVREWLTDPAAAPHGGESTVDLLDRVGGWLDEQFGVTGRVVAVTHPSVIKAAVVHAVHGTPESFWRIDIAPLSRTGLSGRAPLWTLHSLR